MVMKASGKLSALISGSGIFIATYDLAAISIALLVLGKQWNLNGGQEALLGSAALIGSVVGGIIAGLFADRFGRRIMLLGDFITYVVASAGSALSPGLYWLVAFRFIIGLGIGADFAVVFPYLAESRSPEGRGRSMATVMMAANFGMILAYGLGGLFISFGTTGWRYVLAAGGIIAVPALILRERMPESREWLEKRKRSFRHIFESFSEKDRKTVAVTSIAWFSYQVSDQGLSLFLPLLLFSTLGTGYSASSYGSLLIKAVTIPAAVVTVILIDRVGRKPLQTSGFLGRGLSLIAMAFLLLEFGGSYRVLEIALLLITYFFGAMGPDKTIVISPAEQFDTEKRGTGQGISESFGRLGGLVGVSGYSMLSATYGSWSGIMFFGIFAVTGYLVSLAFMRETAPARILAEPDSKAAAQIGNEMSEH